VIIAVANIYKLMDLHRAVVAELCYYIEYWQEDIVESKIHGMSCCI